MIPGDRQSDGWFHGEVAQGRGGKELVTTCKRRHHEGREEEGRGGRAGADVLTTLSMNAENDWQIV